MTEAETGALRACVLFQGLTAEELEGLLPCLNARKRELRRGEALWRTGERVERCAVVLEGCLRAESVSAGGERTVLAVHAPGHLVGDVLMAGEERSPVDVFAAGDSTVLLLSRARLLGGCERCCGAHLRLRENLLSELAEKFWLLRQKVEYLSCPSLRGRIARLLLRTGGAGAGPFSLGMSREDMAALLNVNRSALSRELSRMKAEGLIDYYRDSFRVLSLPGLRSAAG